MSSLIMKSMLDIATMSAGYLFAKSMRSKMKAVENSAITIATDSFNSDLSRHSRYGSVLSQVTTDGNYTTCTSHIGRRKQEVLQGTSSQYVRTASLMGKGVSGTKRRLVRNLSVNVAKELGGAYGEAQAFELVQEEMYATDKLYADMARASTNATPVNILSAVDGLSSVYRNLSNVGDKTVSAAGAALGFRVREVIEEKKKKNTEDTLSVVAPATQLTNLKAGEASFDTTPPPEPTDIFNLETTTFIDEESSVPDVEPIQEEQLGEDE